MLVALSDFEDRPYRIQDQEENKDLESFLESKEEDILRALLGTATYNDFITAIAGSPAQKWIDLRDGKVYTYGGVEYEYKGLVDLLVPCIFAYWVKETNDKYTNSGTVRNSPAMNSTAVSPARRISEAYARFCTKVGNECEYCDTLYGFMLANSSDYPDWVFKEPEPMNQFDI